MARKTTGGKGGSGKVESGDEADRIIEESATGELHPAPIPQPEIDRIADADMAAEPETGAAPDAPDGSSPTSEELALHPSEPDLGATSAASDGPETPVPLSGEPDKETPDITDEALTEKAGSNASDVQETPPPAYETAPDPEPESLAQTPIRENDTAVVPPAPPNEAPQRKGGFLPLLLGGLLAGGIGYGVHFLLEDSSDAEMAALRSEIAQLQASVRDLPPPADLTQLAAGLEELRAQVAEMAPQTGFGEEELGAAISQLRAELEQSEGFDLGPLEARIQEFQDSLSLQQEAQDNWDARMAALEEEMADLRDLAERRVVEAEAAIDSALARSGLDSLRAALETGTPYSAAIARLREAEVDVPEALAAPALTGIATVETLQETFPDAARRALRVALQESPADSTFDRLGNFFRAQIGARSTVPREGDDPDAVLSRAAAAVEAGNLEAALTEIDTLPSEAQDAMGDWLSEARARIAAEEALPALTITIATE